MKWNHVGPVPTLIHRKLEAALRQIDLLKLTWTEAVTSDPENFELGRKRTLRSHAIETGIIERLYDIDWGITNALVADGLIMEVAEREGELEQSTLEIVKSQFDALEFVAEFARTDSPLTTSFIRQLHQLITSTQLTFEAIDSLGRTVVLPLQQGAWKTMANHVKRVDGSLLEYCPPEFVNDEIESLVSNFNSAADAHPIVLAAWLHHAFITIHPFQDGNGRVARALVLLVLLRAQFPPLVVNRTMRERYISALDEANDGSLDPLIFLFAELTRASMLSQFQEPLTEAPKSLFNLSSAWANRMRVSQENESLLKASKFADLANGLQDRISRLLVSIAADLESKFEDVDRNSRATVKYGSPSTEHADYYSGQFIGLAKLHNFYANLGEGKWWTTLKWNLKSERLTFLVGILKVGYGETGLGSVVISAERRLQGEGETDARDYEKLFEPRPTDKVSFSIAMQVNDIWPEVEVLLETCLSAAIDEFCRKLM